MTTAEGWISAAKPLRQGGEPRGEEGSGAGRTGLTGSMLPHTLEVSHMFAKFICWLLAPLFQSKAFIDAVANRMPQFVPDPDKIVAKIVSSYTLDDVAKGVCSYLSPSHVAEIMADRHDWSAAYQKIADQIDASDVAGYLDADELANHIQIDEDSIAERVDLGDLARKLDYESLAAEVSFKELADSLDYDQITSNLDLDYSEIAGNLDASDIASEIDVDYDSLAESIDYDRICDRLDVKYDELASNLDSSEIAEHIEVDHDEIADRIDYKALAAAIIAELGKPKVEVRPVFASDKPLIISDSKEVTA